MQKNIWILQNYEGNTKYEGKKKATIYSGFKGEEGRGGY
jgi:hypothetical protein